MIDGAFCFLSFPLGSCLASIASRMSATIPIYLYHSTIFVIGSVITKVGFMVLHLPYIIILKSRFQIKFLLSSLEPTAASSVKAQDWSLRRRPERQSRPGSRKPARPRLEPQSQSYHLLVAPGIQQRYLRVRLTRTFQSKGHESRVVYRLGHPTVIY